MDTRSQHSGRTDDTAGLMCCQQPMSAEWKQWIHSCRGQVSDVMHDRLRSTCLRNTAISTTNMATTVRIQTNKHVDTCERRTPALTNIYTCAIFRIHRPYRFFLKRRPRRTVLYTLAIRPFYECLTSVDSPQSHRAYDQVTTYLRPKNVGIVGKS